jgi:hypothetical protein
MNYLEINRIADTIDIEDAGLAHATRVALAYYLEAYGVETLESEDGEPQSVRILVIENPGVIETLISPFQIEHSEKDDDGFCKITVVEQEIDQARVYIIHEDNLSPNIARRFEDELEEEF